MKTKTVNRGSLHAVARRTCGTKTTEVTKRWVVEELHEGLWIEASVQSQGSKRNALALLRALTNGGDPDWRVVAVVERRTTTRTPAACSPSTQESRSWRPAVRMRALHSRVLIVAKTRREGAWKAYCSNVRGMNHENEVDDVLAHGDDIGESLARFLFPEFEGVPYAR